VPTGLNGLNRRAHATTPVEVTGRLGNAWTDRVAGDANGIYGAAIARHKGALAAGTRGADSAERAFTTVRLGHAWRDRAGRGEKRNLQVAAAPLREALAVSAREAGAVELAVAVMGPAKPFTPRLRLRDLEQKRLQYTY
jgi:hypothetical protein